jgi:histidinol-phosphate aminotransferase
MNSRKGLKDIVPYSVPPFTRKDKIRFDLNENNFGPSPKVLKAIKKAKHRDFSMYPEYAKLIKKIAIQFRIKSEYVLLTDGGDDAIRCVIDAFVDREEEILIPVPNYSMFELYAKLSGAEIKNVTYNEDFSFPVEQVLKNITAKTKMVVIVNPANPSGTLIAKDDLIKILDKAKNSIVLLDETYFHFSGKSFSELLNTYENLVIVQSFSKVYGLAGLRLGIILARENVLTEILKVAFPYPVSSLSAIAGYASIKDTKYNDYIVKRTNTEKKYLVKELKKIANDVKMTYTNFILVRFDRIAENICKELIKKGILVKYIGSLPLLKDYLRISIGTHRENKILIKNLKEIIPGLL